nr:Copia protein [Ipomoea batatas]
MSGLKLVQTSTDWGSLYVAAAICTAQLNSPCEDWTKELISEVNSPGAGSSWFFQDDRYVSCPVTKSHPKFMPGKYVSVRYSKLCQTEFSGLSGFPSSASLTTRFPESSNCAIGSFTDLELLVDHTTPLLPFTRTRIPGLMTLRIPVVLYRGASLLATQTYVLTDMFLYHMPTYRFFVLSGLKNPSSKVPLGDETMVSSPPSCRDRAVVMVSVALKLLLMGRSKDRRKNRNKQPFLDAFILPPLSIPFSEATEYNIMPFLLIDIVT